MRSRTYAAALLVCAYVLAYADRLAVSILLPSIKSSFQLTLMEASLLVGFAFSLLFGVASVPLGLLVDRGNRRNLLAMGIALWSLATVASGLSTSFWQLFLARIAVGVGEACLHPAAASLLADYYPPAQRGRAITFTQAGTPIGSVVGTMGAGWLLTWFSATNIMARLGWGLENWSAVFLVLGAPGLVLAAMIMGIKEPPRRETVDTQQTSAGSAIGLFRRHPLGLCAFVLLYALAPTMAWAILAWAPTIYITSYHLSAAAAGTIIGGMLFLCSFTAYLLSGVCSDALKRARPRNGRVFMPGLALPVGMVAMVCLYFAHSVATTTAAIGTALFVSSFLGAGAVPALQAVVPNRLRGRMVAILFLVTNILGLALAPTLVAFAAEKMHGAEAGLQGSLAAVCLGTAVAAMMLWPVVLRTYSAMRNYEADNMVGAEPQSGKVFSIRGR